MLRKQSSRKHEWVKGELETLGFGWLAELVDNVEAAEKTCRRASDTEDWLKDEKNAKEMYSELGTVKEKLTYLLQVEGCPRYVVSCKRPVRYRWRCAKKKCALWQRYGGCADGEKNPYWILLQALHKSLVHSQQCIVLSL